MPTLVEMYDEADRLKDQGRLPEAAAKLEEILAQDESYTLAHSALAVVLTRLAKHDDAIRHARRACELAPSDPFSYTALSVTYQRAFAGTGNQQYIQLAEEAMYKSRNMSQPH